MWPVILALKVYAHCTLNVSQAVLAYNTFVIFRMYQAKWENVPRHRSYSESTVLSKWKGWRKEVRGCTRVIPVFTAETARMLRKWTTLLVYFSFFTFPYKVFTSWYSVYLKSSSSCTTRVHRRINTMTVTGPPNKKYVQNLWNFIILPKWREASRIKSNASLAEQKRTKYWFVN